MSKDEGDQSPFCKCAPKPPHSRSPSSPPPPQHTLLTDGVQGHQGPPTLAIISPASTKPARCFLCPPAVSPALPTSFPARFQPSACPSYCVLPLPMSFVELDDAVTIEESYLVLFCTLVILKSFLLEMNLFVLFGLLTVLVISHVSILR